LKKIVLILRGLPGSGKSLFLSLLAAYVHISMDEFWTKDGAEYKFDYTRLREGIDWTHKQFIEALEVKDSNLPIVVNNVSYLEEHYAFFRDEALLRGHTVLIHTVERPIEDCIEHGIHGVPADKVFQMLGAWQHVNGPAQVTELQAKIADLEKKLYGDPPTV